MQRRNFIQNLAFGSAALAAAPWDTLTKVSATEPLPVWPLPPLKNMFPDIIRIDSVELHKTQGQHMMIVRSGDLMGVTQCNMRMPNLISMLKGLVIPHFAQQDARNLPQLVDNAYRLNTNYKYAGMPLWNCIGSVEIAVWDLLGKAAQKTVAQLLGAPARSDYPIYISDFNREGDPLWIAEELLKKLAVTGAQGIKIKVGGRMVNTPANTAQTRRLLPAIRKTLGDAITIYADANGSFTTEEGIETGKFLEDFNVAIFEEPCNFENEDGMRQVTKALKKIVLAGGEQDSSVYRFKRLAQQKIYDLLQPDLYYNGGILRTLNVAEMARQYGAVGMAPHSPKADPLIGPFWQVASLIPNLYGLQEFVYDTLVAPPTWHTPVKAADGRVKISQLPGLGFAYDPDIWKTAERVV